MRVLLLSVVAGILLLFATAALTIVPGAGAIGFPLVYRIADPPTCGRLNPFNGCGYHDDLVSLGLDYLFWFSASLASLSIIQLAWAKLTSTSPGRDANRGHVSGS